MSEEKPYRFKITLDIAAIITAIGALSGLYVYSGTQDTTNKSVDLVQESAFNVLNSKIEFTLTKIEALDKHIDDIEKDISAFKAKSALNAGLKECSDHTDCNLNQTCALNKCKDIPAKIKLVSRKIEDFDEIKQFVQTKKRPLFSDSAE